ncbi:MAG: M48 family metalloprotease [Thermoanaerobaculia bacterium]
MTAGLVATALLFGAGCATNPATGKNQLNFYSEAQEIEMGRKADRQISAEMGVVDDSGLQRFVADLGQRLAAKSERPGLPWSFKVMDDPAVNAFALPGGFIYVTRGILGHMTSEAELASVLGHEIGHVTAQHSMNQMSKAQLVQGGLLAGVILSPEVAQVADLAGVGMQALFLKYGRDDERQADDLGLRYMAIGGYETREMPKLFQLLDAVSSQAGAGRVPNWLASHPDPGSRADRARQRIAERQYPEGEVNARSYVERLDGLAFGADPRRGFFEGATFHHPDLAFSVRFPDGWKRANEPDRVVALHPDRIAMLQVKIAPGRTAREAADNFRRSTGASGGGTGPVEYDGLAAVRTDFSLARQQGTPLVGTAYFLEHSGRVFEIVGFAPQERWEQARRELSASLRSFSRLTDPELLAARPQRLEIVALPRAMTLAEFAERYPSDVPLATLALINRVEGSTAVLAAGTPVKRVVGRKFGDG